MALTKSMILVKSKKKAFFDNRFFKFRLYMGETGFPGRIRVTTMSIAMRENKLMIQNFTAGKTSTLYEWRVIDKKQFSIEIGREVSGWKI